MGRRRALPCERTVLLAPALRRLTEAADRPTGRPGPCRRPGLTGRGYEQEPKGRSALQAGLRRAGLRRARMRSVDMAPRPRLAVAWVRWQAAWKWPGTSTERARGLPSDGPRQARSRLASGRRRGAKRPPQFRRPLGSPPTHGHWERRVLPVAEAEAAPGLPPPHDRRSAKKPAERQTRLRRTVISPSNSLPSGRTVLLRADRTGRRSADSGARRARQAIAGLQGRCRRARENRLGIPPAPPL
jgi:hypothetical protein